MIAHTLLAREPLLTASRRCKGRMHVSVQNVHMCTVHNLLGIACM